MADLRLQAKRDTVQIPLYSTEEAFHYPSTQAGGTEINRQVLVNMFPVINKDPLRDEGGEVRLIQRPGLSLPTSTNSDIMDHITLDYSEAMAVLGMRSTAGEVIVAAYADFATPNIYARIVQYRPGVSTILIGSINLTTYGYTDYRDVYINLSEITHGVSTTSLQPGVAITIHPRNAVSTSSNSDMFYAICTSGFFTASSLVTIADTSFPTNTPARGIVGPVVQLNNVHYILTSDGFIYGSYPSLTGPFFNPDIVTWDDVGVTTASQDRDGGVSLIRYKHHLIAFGTSSMEFFNDEGLAQPGLPIARTQQAYARIGLANSKAYVIVDDDLYWIGASQDTGSIGLYKMSGYTPELISSVPYSHTIANSGRYDTELYAFNTMGTTHIITNIGINPLIDGSIMGADEPDNNSFVGSLVYCLDSKAWWVWGFEFTGYDSDFLSFGNGLAPQLRVAVTLRGTSAVRWIYVCAFKDSSDESFGVHPIAMNNQTEYAETAVYDKFRINNTDTTLTYRVPIAIRTNRLQFNALNRKTIHKMKLQSMKIYDESNTFLPSEEWKLYVQVWKDTASDFIMRSTPTADITRIIDLELPAYNPFLTMYNFGTCRSLVLQILSNNAYPTEFGHLETTLTMMDH